MDLARAVAVLLMVQGHTIDALLHPDFRTSLTYNAWLYLRGLTSCTFLFLSGAAFSLTGLSHWDDQGRLSRRSFKRVRRLAFFLALGYFVKFPMGRFVHLPFATDERWRSFLAWTCCRTSRSPCWRCSRSSPSRARRGASRLTCGCWPWCSWGDAPGPWRDVVRAPAAGRRGLPVARHRVAVSPFPWAGFTLLGATFGVTAAPWATRDHLRRWPVGFR